MNEPKLKPIADDMQAGICWIFDDFFSDAAAMRHKINKYFDEEFAKKLDVDKRCIWNYWYVNGLYTYLRTLPQNIFPQLHQLFAGQLESFAAKEFGLRPGPPWLSMYVNGCGQNIHNDARNGQLGYVYSLTYWDKRRFEGGETLIYKLEPRQKSGMQAIAGAEFYDAIDSLFNRLLIFDDRMPHAVRPIQGTMNPVDARFAIHGHFSAPDHIAHIEGGLKDITMDTHWRQIRDNLIPLFHAYGYQGFITVEMAVTEGGKGTAKLKHMQLWPQTEQAKNLKKCLDIAIDFLSGINWPKTTTPSTLVFAVNAPPVPSQVNAAG